MLQKTSDESVNNKLVGIFYFNNVCKCSFRRQPNDFKRRYIKTVNTTTDVLNSNLVYRKDAGDVIRSSPADHRTKGFKRVPWTEFTYRNRTNFVVIVQRRDDGWSTTVRVVKKYSRKRNANSTAVGCSTRPSYKRPGRHVKTVLGPIDFCGNRQTSELPLLNIMVMSRRFIASSRGSRLSFDCCDPGRPITWKILVVPCTNSHLSSVGCVRSDYIIYYKLCIWAVRYICIYSIIQNIFTGSKYLLTKKSSPE